MTATKKRLSFGVAGWSYPDWHDTVYRLPNVPSRQLSLFGDALPEPTRERYVQDPLSFLAHYLDMIEVNSSFYRIPARTSVQHWAERVADFPDFFFTAKINQAFTHEFQRDRTQAGAFRDAFAPLAEAGRLNCLLAQFKYDFQFTPDGMEHVRWIVNEFGSLAPLVFEVRHCSWEHPVAFDWLLSQGVSVAALDYPLASNSFRLKYCPPGGHAYFRLHGRNHDAWFGKHAAPHEPYNYDYADEEVDELAEEARRLSVDAKSLTIVANNHYRGKAVSVALRLKAAFLNQKVPVPAALLDTYPTLLRIAQSPQSV